MNFGTAASAPSSNRLPLDTNKNVNQICQKLPQSEWHIASKPSAIFQLPKRERLSSKTGRNIKIMTSKLLEQLDSSDVRTFPFHLKSRVAKLMSFGWHKERKSFITLYRRRQEEKWMFCALQVACRCQFNNSCFSSTLWRNLALSK